MQDAGAHIFRKVRRVARSNCRHRVFACDLYHDSCISFALADITNKQSDVKGYSFQLGWFVKDLTICNYKYILRHDLVVHFDLVHPVVEH